MDYLVYAQHRLRAFLEAIERVGESEFPHQHSKVALTLLEEPFRRHLDLLEQYDEKTAPDLVKQSCTLILESLFTYLPLLGFILRSTNVRNAFEAMGPLLRLAGDVLEPEVLPEDRKTRLLLSSEWDYSPFTYHAVPALPNFVLIGLPAPESENPLVLPLAGHELGHCLWSSQGLDTKLLSQAKAGVVSVIHTRWTEFQGIFPVKIDPTELTTHLFALEAWSKSVEWCLLQAKETFCDFLGVRLFGAAFLHAFAYLLAPSVGQRSVQYPSVRTRGSNLIQAAKRFGVDVPGKYGDLFEDEPARGLTQSDEFRLSVADSALKMLLDPLATKADEVVNRSGIKQPSKNDLDTIYRRFQLVVPAENTNGIVALVNAAWRGFHDTNLWKNAPHLHKKRHAVLKELVLKNLEIAEIERIVNAT